MKHRFEKRILSLVLCLSMMFTLIITHANFAFSAENEEENLVSGLTDPFRKNMEFMLNGEPVKSTSYRIPTMVTLADGTIVAAADIRWNTTYDGGGLDTLVARSTDGGKSWQYTVANYLGDNGNEYDPQSTTFIDPSLLVAKDGKTVYMLVDLYAYGVALNGVWGEYSQPLSDTGFNAEGYLKLSSTKRSTFDYYLKDGKIWQEGATEPVEGYTVDGYFNIYYNGEKKGNLFCADSPYQVPKTQYLYLTKSTDAGETWSEPTLLNLRSTTAYETALLVAPAGAITTSKGVMVYPVYSYDGTNEGQRSGLIYSTDGVNWERTANFDGLDRSSEASVVELHNGKLRVFFRCETSRLSYADYDLEAKTWSDAVVMDNVPINSDTQMSAISYSRTSNDKQVVLVSCPTGPNAAGSNDNDGSNRINGKIHVLTVNSDGSMTLEKTIDQFETLATGALSAPYTEEDGFFAYSAMTERADGSVLLLYENNQNYWGAGDDKYFTITLKGHTADELGITLDAPKNVILDKNGNRVNSVTVSQYEKAELSAVSPFSKLTADVKYQWQICYDVDNYLWVDIYGEDEKTIKISYGMVATMLDENGMAAIRCESTAGSNVAYSNPIVVTLEMYEPKEPDVVVSESFTTSSGETVTVTVAGNLPEDASVKLEETDSTGIEIDENETFVAALDISIKNADGTEWQPESGETVKVELPAESIGLNEGDRFVVYHLHNGEVKVLGTYTVVDGVVAFDVDGFSKFLFALAADASDFDLPDFSADIGKHAHLTYDANINIVGSTVEPYFGCEKIAFDLTAFSTYFNVRIDDYKVVAEYGLINSVNTKKRVSVWYKVSVVKGDCPDEFDGGIWLLQNYYDENGAEELDTLTLFDAPVVPDEPEEPAEPSVGITVNGETVNEITVSKTDKVTVTATPNVEGSMTYQWQLLIPAANMWVNISGQTAADCTVNYGMIANRLDSNGQAHIRCVTTINGVEVISEPIAVNLVTTYSLFNNYWISMPKNLSTPQSRAEGDAPTANKHNFIVKFYLRDTDEEIYQQFLAEFAENETRTLKIKITEKDGYTAYWCNPVTNEMSEVTNYSFEYTYTFTDSEDVMFAVRYFPNEVGYIVKHYFQNVNDDKYGEPEIENKTGTADTLVGDVHKNVDGFYYIPYLRPTIAPEGSTIIEIYYDRLYRLVLFDLGEGGYGVEPIYAKVGTEITLGTPERPGYAFNGWEYENGTDITGTTYTIPSDGVTEENNPDIIIKAKWTEGTAKYTIVYWKENAEPNEDGSYGYSYWAHRQVTNSKPGITVSGEDDVASYVSDEQYFTFNAARTDKDVVVKGDGTTVVNVYYTRNTYTIYFYGGNTCNIPEHTHGANCNSYLICGKNEHEHTDACGEPVIGCGVTEHKTHTEECITCGEVEHTVHTAECLICEKPASHYHTKECYGVSENADAWDEPDSGYIDYNRISVTGATGRYDPAGSPQNGSIGVLQTRNSWNSSWTNTNEYYIYVGGSWYRYTGDVAVDEKVTASCGLTEGNHTHSEAQGCYSDTVHVHGDGCYADAIHIHTDQCYEYPNCTGEIEHTHTNECYSECTMIEHSHSNSCPTHSGDKVFLVVQAKYDADITTIWETEPVKSDWLDNGWVFKSSITSKYYSFLEKMPGYDIEMYATEWSGSTYTWYYWLEILPGQDTTGLETTTSSGKTYYKYHTTTVNGSNLSLTYDEDYFPITGFDQRDENVPSFSNRKANLFYVRNSYEISFNNAGTEVKDKGGNYLYEADISKTYFVPDYPTDFEENAYEFKGWYTTPQCFDGSEFVFEGAKMPANNVLLYAKWAPVTHEVKIFLDDTLNNQIFSTQKISHNDYAMKPANEPVNGTKDFIGWFYIDEDGNEQAFVFTMQIKRDLNIYAKWRDTAIINYVINYVGIDGNGKYFMLASPTYGQQYASKTVTFEPKGTEQYFVDYQDDGYFAMTPNHSIVMGEACSTDNPNCIWDPETKTHTFTFYYELGPVVPYEVHYYYKGTTTPVFVDENNNEIFEKYVDNRKSVVIAYAKGKVGYKADAVQKSLVVIKGAENKIIFYYSADENATYYEVIHHLMDKDGNEKNKHTLAYNANVNEEVKINSATVAPMSFSGFTFVENYVGTLREGVATKDPILQLHLYYVENQVTIKYEVVGGETGGGTVSRAEETLGAVYGVAQGSLATPKFGYKFVGWYSHWDCEESQLLSTDLKWQPTKPSDALWVNDTTYYAKFEVDLTSLTIKKDGVEDYKDIDPNQTFIFNVNGNGVDLDVTVHRNAKGEWKTVIDGLTVGATYTVTEKTDWSWRYEYKSVSVKNATEVRKDDKGSITITLGLDGVITFTNSRSEEKWLDGDSWCNNLFK